MSDEKSRLTKTNGNPSPAGRAQLEHGVSRRDDFIHVEKTTGALPLWKKVIYGAPQFSMSSLTMLISIHGTIFFTKIGAQVAFIAFFTALARSFDVITDPVMGYISDVTRTKWGRRRPFMFGGCFFYAFLFVMLFSPPTALSGTQVALWFGFFYVLFYLADTLTNVPYGALGPELTDDTLERNSLFFYVGLFKGVGILCAAVLPIMASFYYTSYPDSSSFMTVHCLCEEVTPAGPGNAALYGVAWDEAAYGAYPDNYYNSTICDAYSKEAEAWAGANEPSPEDLGHDAQLDSWCEWREDCDDLCDVDSSRAAMTNVAIGFAVYFIVTMVACAASLQERDLSSMKDDPPLVPALMATLRNKPFMGLLPAWALDMTSFTMIGTMLPFYVEYVVAPQNATPWCDDGKRCPGLLPCDADENCCSPEEESEDYCDSDIWLGFGLVGLMSATILSMPLWLQACKTFGKNRTWLTFNLVTALTNGLFVLVGEGDPKLTVFLAFLNGIPNGAAFLTDSIVADVIDYDEFLTGTRSEGRFTIFQTFIPKIVSIPSQAIPLALLSMFGFIAPIDGVSQPQPEGVKNFIKFVFFFLPCLLACLSWVIKLRFPIKTTDQVEKISAGIQAHMNGKKALDPLSNTWRSLFDMNVKDANGAAIPELQWDEKHLWDLDCFFVDQLRLLDVKGPQALVNNMLRNVRLSCFSAVFFGLLMTATIAGGALTSSSWSWVPAISVISMGMSLTALGFNKQRLAAAYRIGTVPQKLLKLWIQHVTGSGDKMMTVVKDISEELQNLDGGFGQSGVRRSQVVFETKSFKGLVVRRTDDKLNVELHRPLDFQMLCDLVQHHLPTEYHRVDDYAHTLNDEFPEFAVYPPDPAAAGDSGPLLDAEKGGKAAAVVATDSSSTGVAEEKN